MNARTLKFGTCLIALLAVPFAMQMARSAARPDESVAAADETAIKQVVAGFSDGWNSHDAHSMCLSLADDVQWVSWRGEIAHSRKAVSYTHLTLPTNREV